MANAGYNWKRYWCLRDGGFHIDANGFLLRGKYFDKDTIEFESIAEIPCLVLLGEPGIGKTRALRDAVEFVSKSFPNDRCFPLNLRSFGSETRLFDALFRSEEIENWLNGSHRLHLFLDSFDECLLRVDTVAALLADELKTGKYPIDRLLFRITSRTAEFPRGLENDLREIWKSGDGEPEKIKIYELCPLQASDVWAAAQTAGITPEGFFKEVTAKNAGTLAARPVTLRFLFDVYRKNNSFPDKLTDLYEQGCRVLCDEQNDERRVSTVLKGKLTADQRLQIAGRIAAVMVFCNKIVVWKDAETGETEETDVLIRELAGGFEQSANIDFPITEEAVRETLVHTGLFTARGASRLGWSHQTFTEFLAAWYVARQNPNTHQILSLVTHPSDAQKQIAPQLQEAAAWLASLRPDVFDELLKTDPLLLLRSDVASFSADLRAKLVDELFKIFAAEQASDWGWHSYYPRLKYLGLAAKILPVIKDRNAHYLARRFAIDVAEACELRELQNDLADIILDETEPDYVRSNAGYALWRVGDAETKKRIKHYATDGSPNDKDKRVRGIALLCNWDENLTAEEVFSSLVHSPHLHDSYGLFLSRFIEKLKIADLPVALRWVRENAERFGGDFSIERVIDEIMLLGWQNLDAPEVLQTLAEAALVRLRLFNHHVIKISNIYEGEQISESLADDGKRRKVLRAIAPLLSKKPHDFFRVFRSPLLRPIKEDLPFLINALADSNSAVEQENLAEIITEFYRFAPIEPEIFGFLYDGYIRSENVRKFFSHIIEPVELDSHIAFKMKSDYANALKQQKEFAEMEAEHRPPLLDPPPKERVLRTLERIEKGEKIFFWLTQELSLEADSQFYSSDWEADATKLLGWIEADSQTRERIIAAATDFVLHGESENNEWVGTNSFQYSALGGFRALVLLLETVPDFVRKLEDKVWQKWAAIIALHPSFGRGEEEPRTHTFLIREVYKHAPDEIIATILKVIDAANETEDHLFFEKNWAAFWDEKFKTALRQKLNDAKLKFSIWGSILEKLLEYGDAPAQEIAQNVLTEFVAGKAEKERALLAAASLMRHAQSADWWRFVWKAIEKDADFGRAFIEAVCFRTRPANKLNEGEAAEFYIWMIENFPLSEDPEIPMGHAFGVSTRMEITTFRDSILGDLKQRGTPESLHALEQIAVASSELAKRLHWTLIEARENVRRHTWQPPTPAELLALLKQKNAATALPPTAEIMKKPLTDEEIRNLIWNGKTVAEIPALFDFLKVYRDRPNDVVFFVGAGLSMPLFPGWKAVLSGMIDETSLKIGRKFSKTEIKKMLKKGEYLEVANVCADELGQTAYTNFIRRKFRKDASEIKARVPPAYDELLRLDIKTILTTNYDQIPEVAGSGNYAVYRNTNSADAMNDFRDGRKMVFKIHGCVTEQSSIILTQQDYQRIMYQGSELRKAVETILNSKNVIFLGFSFSDPHLDSILDELFVANRGIGQGKFALMEGLSKTEIQRKAKRFGLSIIPYQKFADSHPEVLEFVRLMSQARG